jgi:hypothetical protein
MEINLLPPQQIKKIKLASLFKTTSKLILLMVFINFISLGYLYFLNQELKNLLKEAKNKSSEKNIEEKVENLAYLEGKVKETYTFIDKAKKINKEKPLKWSEVLEELILFCGEGINLEKISVDEKNLKEIRVSGNALEREGIINLKEKLEKSTFYSKVEFPVSNLISKENISFEFTLTLKDG